MNKLPIKATLITRNGFSKSIEIDEIKPVILIPIFPKLTFITSPEEIPDIPTINVQEFIYERQKIVRQKNGLEHIVVTYREI